MKFLAKQKAENVVFLDESGIDRGICREYARAPRGQKAVCERSGKREKRINIVAGVCTGKVIAHARFDGACKTEIFTKWVKDVLVKNLRKGQIVILDNATFHKKKSTLELIKKAGVTVQFLPPYSPDLNPIEKYWATLKSKLKYHRENTESIIDFLNNQLNPTVLTS